MNDLINYLPTYERNSVILQKLLLAEGLEIDEQEMIIEDLSNQMSISTATWALDIYEKALNIKTDLTKAYEERRSVIKSKLRGTGKVDKDLIKLVVDSYTNGNVDVGFNGEIEVTFNDVKGVPPNMQDVQNSIENVKPAHLGIFYQFAYLLIKDIHNVMTLNELQSTQINKFAFNEVI